VIFKVGDSRIAPAIASSPFTFQAEFLSNHTVSIFGQSFGHFHSQSVCVVSFGIISRLLELIHGVAGRLSHRDNLKRYNINFAAVY